MNLDETKFADIKIHQPMRKFFPLFDLPSGVSK